MIVISYLVLYILHRVCYLDWCNYQMGLYRWVGGNIVKFVQLMYRRESGGQGSRKKIKHFSYSESDRIGKGYSSIVFKGSNDLTNETVAIKAIDMKGVKDAVSRQMLDCEIQALTKLKHPNILRCIDVVRQPSHCYIITQYCNEGDLSSLLKRKRRLPEAEVLRLAKDIVGGFVEMAERSFLHRDLKLANILLSEGRAVMADFGFAKKHSNVFEKEKYNVGSPLYMSPEALRQNVYSPKNDIWSIGVMLYELLHGETPWECRTEKELIDKMVRLPVKFRDSLAISEDTQRFIRKCLQVSEEARMSLQDLKLWNAANSYQALAQCTMVFLPTLELIKPSSSKEQHVLGELTNRPSSRSQSNFTYHSKPAVQGISLSKEGGKGAEGGKGSVEGNNNLLILEINVFRLLFKIYERMRKYCGEERELLGSIGNEVLRRVGGLHGVVCAEKENVEARRAEQYGLVDAKAYLSEDSNPSIKKYKSVVREYFKKYTQEIAACPGVQGSAREAVRDALASGRVVRESLSTEEMVMVYWMIEFAALEQHPKKEYLDGVIDPKNLVFSRNYLLDRIKAL